MSQVQTLAHEGGSESLGDQIGASAEELYRKKILHILDVYPKLSPSHVQISIGTAVPSSIWKPVLDKLVEEGSVILSTISKEAPTGRQQNYVILSLPTQAV